MSKSSSAVRVHRAPFQQTIFTQFCLISLLCLASFKLLANGDESDASSAPALSQSERMQWWSDARFGMFIHWGTYSVLGGVYKGKDYSKEFSHASAEWIKNRAKIPDDEYVKLAHQFNPTNFNAAEWVSLAKAAGMKYIVITAKHHEGFCMFDSKTTDYDIMDASPFKRDIIKELADECRKQGLHFGVYYSQKIDWHNEKHPGYHDLLKGQISELLTNYGDIAVMWFDMGDGNTAFNNELGALVRKLQPKTIIGSRLYAGKMPDSEKKYADFKSLGDRSVATRPVADYGECPMTTRLNWAYAQHDEHWKSVKLLIEYLVVDAARGANMLLNFGPKPDGTFTEQDTERLKGIGKWMAVNGESIYGTKASPLNYDFPWGLITQNAGLKRLYLHVLKWNPKGIELTGILGQPSHAYLLADPARKDLVVERNGDALTAKVPAAAPDENDSVIVMEFADGIKVDANAKSGFHWKPTPVMGLSEKSGGKTTADGDTKKAGGSEKSADEGQ